MRGTQDGMTTRAFLAAIYSPICTLFGCASVTFGVLLLTWNICQQDCRNMDKTKRIRLLIYQCWSREAIHVELMVFRAHSEGTPITQIRCGGIDNFFFLYVSTSRY